MKRIISLLTAIIVLTGVFFVPSYGATGAELPTGNKDAVNKALASVTAGSVIEIPDGIYYDWNINISANGTKTKPVTIKAKNPGKAVIKGESSIVVSGDYVNIEGLRFEEITTYNNVVDFKVTSYGSKIYDCAFYNCHPKDGDDTSRQFWVVLNGTRVTVENCFFSHKHSVGQMVSFSKSASNVGIPDEHLIKNCYFGNITNQTGNGYEAIRMGSSTYCFENSRTVVEGCFFEKCDGEGETISVKTCENIVRNNTLYNTNGAIVLRHGDRSDIYGNLFVGGVEKKRVSGVRIIGEDHKVHDNYFYNMSNASQVIFYFNGNPYENIENHWYYPVKNAQVYNNTFIGGDRLVNIGNYSASDDPANNRIMAPEGCFKDNALVSYTGRYEMFVNGDPAPSLNVTDEDAYHKVKFSGNIAYGKEFGYHPEGVTKGYFELSEDGNYYSAPNGKGANLEEVKKAPTSPFDIISDWVKEVYYDSGLITFEPVPNDVFNIEDAHINNIVPFDVTYSLGSGGSLTLRENGTVVSGKTTFSGNPELVFKAVPDTNKKISRWYVNGIEVDEQNAKALGVKIATPTSATLAVRSLYKNYNIEVEFAEAFPVPDSISAPVTGFEGNGSISFINQKGTKTSVSGCYKLLAARLEVLPYLNIIEYGFLVYTADGEIKRVKSEVSLTDSGAYGVLFYGFNKGADYSFYPYAVYQAEGMEPKTITGNMYNFSCK